MSHPVARLGDVVHTRTGAVNPLRAPEHEFIYIDVSAVDNQLKVIANPRRIVGREAPSRARKLVRAGDVLVSTVRPNLNAVAVVPESLDNQVASTGFAVLRATNRVIPEYLFYFVRTPRFIAELTKLTAGAMYPAVSDNQVLEQLLPVPPVEKQRRIVDLLSRAEGIVQLRREVSAKTADLIPAIFHEMFGDPATNPKGWPIRRVADFVAQFEGGKNLQAGRDGGTTFRILKVSAVTTGEYLETESKPTPDGYMPLQKHVVRHGDLLFSRANTEELVGATALVETTNGLTLLPDKLWRLVWSEQVEPRYMHALFQSSHVRRELGKLSSGTSASMRNISQAKLFQLLLPVAPIHLQQVFVRRVDQLRSAISLQLAAGVKGDEIFAALLARTFCGLGSTT